KSYQEQDAGRTLFWATHDLALAKEFATDFLIVRRQAGSGKIEMKACGSEQAGQIEEEVYAGNDIPDVSVPLISAKARRSGKAGEVPFTEAKVGNSLTFARRDAPSLARVGHLGRWLGSIEGAAPPLFRGFTGIVRLYRRFSDHAVAAAVGLSILMLSFVFLGL